MRYEPLFAQFPHIAHGGDYNPDQWMDRYPEIIDEDFRLMKEAGCDTFSVGIFSWSRYEPREGEYHFEWMDRLLDRMAAAGYNAVLATPSGGKPAWLSQAYPEVRRVLPDGQRERQHERHNHCFTSPVFREKIGKLNRRLAQRYKNHPAVKMWHISNEYSGTCYCDYCLNAFREWLQARYQTLDELNHAWWAHFWSHTYTSWEQIDPRDATVDGLVLDWKRFTTYQTVDFMKHEIKCLRDAGALQPVTTNMMGSLEGIDFWRYKDVVDVISDDCYPVWRNRTDDWKVAAGQAMLHDMHRSMKGGKPWLLLESCPSAPQWHAVPKLKRPGLYRAEMLHAVAHGSDSVMYFQWRKGRGSMEKFHGAVVDHEGSSNSRVFREVSDLGRTLKQLDDVRGTTVDAKAALIFDWEVRWALESSMGPIKPGGGDVYGTPQYVGPAMFHHRPFWRHGVATDIIESTCDFDRYQLIVAPQLYMLKPGVAERLIQFVKQGGTLVLTYLSGIVDPSNLCLLGGWPGNGLREIAGVWAEEIDYLYPEDVQHVQFQPQNSLGLTGSFRTGRTCDIIHAEGAEVLATYSDDFYAGQPALTKHNYGNGSVYYIAAELHDDALYSFYTALIQRMELPKTLEAPLPLGVTAYARTDGDNEYVFVQNFTPEDQLVNLGTQALRNMETGEQLQGEMDLKAYASLILQRPAKLKA